MNKPAPLAHFLPKLYKIFLSALTGEVIWQNTENRKPFRLMPSKDSVVRWHCKTYRPGIERYETKMKDPKLSHMKLYRLGSREEIKELLNEPFYPSLGSL